MPFDGQNISVVAQNLMAAKERLLTKGWIKRATMTDNGYCAVGAIVGDNFKENFGSEIGYLARCVPVLPLFCREPVISWWNDDEATTKEDVIAVFDNAIALAIAEHV